MGADVRLNAIRCAIMFRIRYNLNETPSSDPKWKGTEMTLALRSLLHPVRTLREQFRAMNDRHQAIEARLMRIQEALGRIEKRHLPNGPDLDIHTAEFRVFSQWGEDGVLQHLLRHIPVSRKIFIEFGVENYMEANTRFLLVNDNWQGLVIDGDSQNIASIRNSDISWRHTLKAEQAFITRENINDIIRRNGIEGEIGLLSIDIDGNDYWVWEAIEAISPAVTVIEYNARFGADRAVTVPYKADFARDREHYSYIYYGASLAALCLLSKRKGYAFVGCNLAGSNAFFVRENLRPAEMPVLTPEQGFVRSKFRRVTFCRWHPVILDRRGRNGDPEGPAAG